MRFRALAVLALAAAGCSSPPPTPAAAAPADQPKKNDSGQSLFDGKALGAWKPVDFGGDGPVKVENGCISVAEGATLSGIRWTGEAPPRTNYEFSLEAMKVEGSDFFCCIVFPVGKDTCSFVAGGWGGGVTGLSSVDHMNASENETASDQDYAKNKWYAIRLRVTAEKIEVWVDSKQVVHLELANRQISVHPAVESAAPLGVTNYQTSSLFRKIRLRTLE
ncbi:MAG TPA: DUF1080 domain-containing protein [Planctomycetota bacterium]|nr:DUF1080 domain-containing protein [Planctomycetota bacterium]